MLKISIEADNKDISKEDKEEEATPLVKKSSRY